MNFPLLALIVVSASLSLPVAAQQGPAGVPGAPLIGASIAPPSPPVQAPEKLQPRKRGPVDCTKTKDVEKCKARQEARKQAREACRDKKGAERKQCIRDALAEKK